MNCRPRNAVTALAVVLSVGSLSAHHSFTAIFDVSKQFTLVGTLTKVDWRNPHIQISLEAKGDGGKVEAWVIEGMSPIAFRGRSVGKSDFEKASGQTVTVEAVRAKDGSLYGMMYQITFPDGKSVRLLELRPPT